MIETMIKAALPKEVTAFLVMNRLAVKNLSEVFKPEKLRPPQESEGIS